MLKPGTLVDERYEIASLLGEGGMGSVFRAREAMLDRWVALKILLPELCDDAETRARFEREAQAIAILNHRNISTFYRFGIWQGRLYIAMELLQGRTLREVLSAAGHLAWMDAVRVGIEVCDAMEHAHAAGIIHRDLKPNNIFVLEDDGHGMDPGQSPRIKVIDFGLARLWGGQLQKLTRTGELVGSLYFLSPEQCRGLPADERSDIYALGCVLYECIAGAPPFTADNPVGLMHKHAHESPPGLRSELMLPAVPKELEEVIFKSMTKDPAARYQTMAQFACDLRLIEAGRQEEIAIGGAGEIVRGPLLWRLALALGAAAATLVLLVGSASVIWDIGLAGPVSELILLRRDDESLESARELSAWLEDNGRHQGAVQVADASARLVGQVGHRSWTAARVMAWQSRLLARHGRRRDAARAAEIAMAIHRECVVHNRKPLVDEPERQAALEVFEALRLSPPASYDVFLRVDACRQLRYARPATRQIDLAAAQAGLSIMTRLYGADNAVALCCAMDVVEDLAELGRIGEARQMLHGLAGERGGLLRAERGYATAHVRAASAYTKLEDYSRALVLLDRASRLCSGSSRSELEQACQVHGVRARVYRQQGRLPESIAESLQALKLADLAELPAAEVAPMLLGYADALIRSGDSKGAEARIDQVLKSRIGANEKVEALERKLSLKLRQGDQDAAARVSQDKLQLLRALQGEESLVFKQALCQDLLIRAWKENPEDEDFDRALRFARETGDSLLTGQLLLTRARVENRRGKPSKALDLAEQAHRVLSALPGATFLAARLSRVDSLRALGKPEQAQMELKEAVRELMALRKRRLDAARMDRERSSGRQPGITPDPGAAIREKEAADTLDVQIDLMRYDAEELALTPHESEACLRRLLEQHRQFLETHPIWRLQANMRLVAALGRAGKYHEAVTLGRRLVTEFEPVAVTDAPALGRLRELVTRFERQSGQVSPAKP